LVVRSTCKDKLFLLADMLKKMVPYIEDARKKVQELKMGQKVACCMLAPTEKVGWRKDVRKGISSSSIQIF